MWWLLGACVLIAFFFLNNFFAYRTAKKYLALYEAFVSKKHDKFNKFHFLANELITKAGLSTTYITRHSVGISVDVMHNALNRELSNFNKVQLCYKNLLAQSSEVFKQRMLFSINPLKWVEVALSLPSLLLKFVFSDADKQDKAKEKKREAAIKVTQVIYWIAGAAWAVAQIYLALT